nr:isoprene synthase beta 3 subunit=6 kda peptide {N-terminal} [Populus tremuloides=quaking aspen trees, Michx., leaves, Peptide Partial, 18 aa] [Populus tremuloides]
NKEKLGGDLFAKPFVETA